MIQVYCYDEKGFFTVSKFVDEIVKGMTDKEWEGLYRPKFDKGLDVWVEAATQEEIDNWFSVIEPIPEKDKTRIWQDQVEEAIGLLAIQVAQNTLLQNGGK